MRFQSVKPLNGWRAFAGEVGVIVLGVLIALGLGQLAEDLQWKTKTARGWESVQQELARSAGVFDERRMMAPCLTRRLDELDSILRDARRTGRLPAVGEIGRPGTRPIQDTAYQAIINDETLVHFDRQRQGNLATVYTLVRRYAGPLEDENRTWARLTTMEGPGGPVSDAILADLLTALADARFLTAINNLRAEEGLGAILYNGIKPSYEMVLHGKIGSQREALAQAGERPVCKALVSAANS
jgi:hypothetical protein